MVTKDREVKFVATQTQLAAWKLAAEESGLSLSEWLRQAAARTIASGDRRDLREPSQFAAA